MKRPVKSLIYLPLVLPLAMHAQTNPLHSQAPVPSTDTTWPRAPMTGSWDHAPSNLYFGGIQGDPLTGGVTVNGANVNYSSSTPGWSESVLPWTTKSPLWLIQHVHLMTANFYTSGISDGLGILVNHFGQGDTTALEADVYGRNSASAGSDESNDNYRATNMEAHPAVGMVVAGGGLGSTVLSTSCSGNFCNGLSVGFPLIDTTADVLANTFTKTGTLPSSATIGTLASPVPVSACGTLAADFSNVHRGQVNQSYRNTITISTTADLSKNPSTGSVWSSNPLGVIGGATLLENIGGISHPVSFGPFDSAAHTQTITANFVYSYPSTSTICFGGTAGRQVELAAFTFTPPNGARTRFLVTMIGSPTPTSAILATNSPYDLGTEFLFGTQPIKIYHGGRTNQVHGAVQSNPALPNYNSFTPDVDTLYLEPNDAAWAIGDAVEQQSLPSAGYKNFQTQIIAANPFATVTSWQTEAISNQLSSPFLINRWDSTMQKTIAHGGGAAPAGMINHVGPYGTLFTADRAPETWTQNGGSFYGAVISIPSKNGDPCLYLYDQKGTGYGMQYCPPSADGSEGGYFTINDQKVCTVANCGMHTLHVTTKAVASETIPLPRFPATGSIVGVVPTNPAAIASIGYGVAAKNNGSITFQHTPTANMTFDITYTTY